MIAIALVGALLLLASIASYWSWRIGRDLYGIQFILFLFLLFSWSVVFAFFLPKWLVFGYVAFVWIAFAWVIHLVESAGKRGW